jgi:hydrogenase expression/formation protein HypD
MKYIDEFRDTRIVKELASRIKNIRTGPVNIMEVCGTHTMAIFRSGLRSLLPPRITIISGPGCPVCVTAQDDIDRMLALARMPEVIITTFGDMLKVPGSAGSLEKERAQGADIRIVYSPLDALEIARAESGKEVVFLGVGFETTAPAVASTIWDAHRDKIKNFSVYSCHKCIPPALAALLAARELRLHGFICPGHVSTIIGSRAYDFVAEDYGIPCVVSGFEPVDILEAIRMLLEKIEKKKASVSIQYRRAVNPGGNPAALQLLSEVFESCDGKWRGLGTIEKSGLALRKRFFGFDAAKRFTLRPGRCRQPKGCLCGEVLRGVKTPAECGLFAKACTPENPYGPCMVSSEGTCAAWFKYGDRK